MSATHGVAERQSQSQSKMKNKPGPRQAFEYDAPRDTTYDGSASISFFLAAVLGLRQAGEANLSRPEATDDVARKHEAVCRGAGTLDLV